MRWEELTKRQRGLLLALASAEAVLTITAAVSLARTPEDAVRGRKGLWWPAIFVQPIGPIAYLLWGRQRPGKT
jgi:hypothetical protein